MRSDHPIKHFILAFVFALIGYAVCYHFIEHRRTRNGPWEVTFTNTPAGNPAMLINQPKLRIANVLLVFTNSASTLVTNLPSSLSPQPSSTSLLDFSHPQPVPWPV